MANLVSRLRPAERARVQEAAAQQRVQRALTSFTGGGVPSGPTVTIGGRQVAVRNVAASNTPALAIGNGGNSSRFNSTGSTGYIEKTVSELSNTKANIDAAKANLEQKAAVINAMGSSMVQRGTVFHNRLIQDYNLQSGRLRSRVSNYNKNLIITKFKKEQGARDYIRKTVTEQAKPNYGIIEPRQNYIVRQPLKTGKQIVAEAERKALLGSPPIVATQTGTWFGSPIHKLHYTGWQNLADREFAEAERVRIPKIGGE